MDFLKMKQLVEDGSSSSSSSKKLLDDTVKGPKKPFDLNLLPDDVEEDDHHEFCIEIFGGSGTPQIDLNLTDNEVVDANSNSNGLFLPYQSPTHVGGNNDASIFNNTTTSSPPTKLLTPSHHLFDGKRKFHHNYDGSSASTGTARSLRPRRLSEQNYDRRICTNYKCRTRNTPMWRRGPLGPKTLCNACGIQYKKQVSSRGSDLL